MKRILYILPALLLMVSCGRQNNKSLSDTSKMSDADITACLGRVVGMFGSQDTLAHFRDIFTEYYYRTIDYYGPHTMAEDNVRNDLFPLVKSMLEEFPPVEARYFRHFKGNSYRLVHTAKDSETMERMVVYQALYGSHGYWVRPEKMFFERIERNGQEFPRFSEISNINVK